MYCERTKPADNLVQMVLKMNKVGISKLKKYVEENHKKENFERNIEIIRCAAKYGYCGCITKFSISKQRAEQIVKKYYKYACEIDKSMGG